MRKKLLSIIALLLVVACAGCGAEQAATTENLGQKQSAAGGQVGKGQGERRNEASGQVERRSENGSASAERQPGSRPQQQVSQGDGVVTENSKVVTGKVKSIVGNEVVLIITETSNGKSGKMGQGTQSQNSTEVAQTAESPVIEEENSTAAGETTQTQKTETYLIPVGMAVGSKDFSVIKAGNTLKIYFGTHPEDGSEIITAVELRS